MPPRKSDKYAPAAPVKKPRHARGAKLLAADLKTLRELRDADLAAKSAAKATTEAYKDFESYVIARMEFEQVPKQQAGETTFYTNHTPYAVVQNADEFRAWAAEHDPDLLREPEPRQGDLNGVVRRLLDDGQPLPDGVGFYVKSRIDMRAS